MLVVLIQLSYLQNGQEILDNLAELKPGLVDRYEKWRQEHPDGVEEDTTPNARTQQLANENATRARAQHELQIREEETARAIQQQKEQERIAAEEAARWVQQRKQLEAQEEARRQEMVTAAARKAANPPNVLPQPPDLTFSRPNFHNPPGQGSQSTVVLMNGQARGQVEPSRSHQQEQMRLREEEITRRQEQKRRQEQDGIARRQQEAEEAARVARQNSAAHTGPYPPTNMSPANAPPPAPSLFPTHVGASSSAVPKSMFYPTAVQYPTLGPTAMPLESPLYEGDSTDSESLHHDFRRLSRTRIDSESQKSPAKPVRRYVLI